MTDTRTVNDVPLDVLKRALSATIAACGPGSPTERDLREQIAKAVTLEVAISNACSLAEFRHKYMGVPYTSDVDFLVMPAHKGDKS